MISFFILLLGVIVPGVFSQISGQYCKDGNGIYSPDQQWAGPPGSCLLRKCMRLMDGVVGIMTQRCVEVAIQGHSSTGSCSVTAPDSTKVYPDCCPSVQCRSTSTPVSVAGPGVVNPAYPPSGYPPAYPPSGYPQGFQVENGYGYNTPPVDKVASPPGERFHIILGKRNQGRSDQK